MNKRRRNRRGKASATKVGWRVAEWGPDVGVSRAFTWQLIASGEIDSVKAGNARIITTPPAVYLANLANKTA